MIGRIKDSDIARRFKMNEVCAVCGCKWGFHEGMKCPEGNTTFVPVTSPATAPPALRIGRFTLSRHDAESLWIATEDGEGGQFRDEVVEEALREMYKRYF